MEDKKPKPRWLQRRRVADVMITRMIDLRANSGDEKDAALLKRVATHDASGKATEVPLHELLKEYARLIWLDHDGAPEPEEKARRLQLLDDMGKMAPDVQERITDVMAHAGQLHQIAGLLARESVMARSSNANEVNPIRRMLFTDPAKGVGRKFDTVEEALAAIAVPKFEPVFTGHPTNTNSIESMAKQRKLAEASTAYVNSLRLQRPALTAEYRDKADEALLDFARTPLLNMAAAGEEDKTPVPVGLTVPQEVSTMLYFLGNAYNDLPGTYGAFDTQLSETYGETYHPEQLKLGIRYHSWGSSGDKDGNNNINADTTLKAVLAHKVEILQRYLTDMEALHLPEAQNSVRKLAEAVKELRGAEDVIRQREEHTDRHYFTPREFAETTRSIRMAVSKIHLEDMTGMLGKAYANAPEDQKKPMLDLLRRMRTFGTSFGHIEYRETAEEYTRVMELMVPGYAAMDEPQRCAELNRLMANPKILSELAEELDTLVQDRAGKPYSSEDARAIAYQTLKRMELARDFPDMIENNVLAECKNTSNILEALVLQHAVAKDGKRALLGIVPLFEEHATLKAAPDIVRGALENPHYQQHLKTLSAERGAAKTQQIQIAHSDNAKRAGVAATRSLISKAHENIREMFRDFAKEHEPIKLEFFEGGSQSDCMRGGVRAISAMIDAYNVHDFFKTTFQGGDLLNYFNLAASSVRLFAHNIANSVMHTAPKKDKLTGEILPSLRPRPTEMDEQVINAFDQAKESYIELFDNPDYKDFIDRIGYSDTTLWGNTSSRAGKRKNVASLNETRAIGISETLQHAGLVGTWIGVRNIEKILNQAVTGAYSPIVRKQIYENSATYRDTIDRMMYGLMRSDLSYVAKRSGNHKLMPEFRAQYLEAFKLCLESYTGRPVEQFLPPGGLIEENIDNNSLRVILKQEVFPHVADVVGDQERFVELAHAIQEWQAVPAGEEPTPAQRNSQTLAHNMLDTVYHGRLPLIDDPAYAKQYCKVTGIQRPWVVGEGIPVKANGK